MSYTSRTNAVSSSEPSHSVLLDSETTTKALETEALRGPLRGSQWMWYGLGTVTGIGLTAGAVRLAGELN